MTRHLVSMSFHNLLAKCSSLVCLQVCASVTSLVQPCTTLAACTLQLVLREFLNPRQWKPSEDAKFFLDAEQINSLCEVAERVFKSEPSVLRLKGISLRYCQTPTYAQSSAIRNVQELAHNMTQLACAITHSQLYPWRAYFCAYTTSMLQTYV